MDEFTDQVIKEGADLKWVVDYLRYTAFRKVRAKHTTKTATMKALGYTRGQAYYWEKRYITENIV